LPIWGRERPATLVILNIEGPAGEQWVSGETPPELRAGVEAAARERALPLIWAGLDSQDYAQAADAMGSSGVAGLLETAQAHGANAALVGRVRGASVRWLLAWSEGADESVGGLDAGVHAAADAYAQVFAASGSSLESVTIEVAGLNDLDAYAQTLNYLEKLTLVRSVALEQIAGDAMRFRLSVRGDAETLLRALALDRRLAPLDAPDRAVSSGRILLRYLP
jgi:hypothetical protein